MDDDENGGLFNIQPDSEDEEEMKKKEEKVPRDFQSEEDFQRQRESYKPKIEVGDVSFSSFGNGVRSCEELTEGLHSFTKLSTCQ